MDGVLKFFFFLKTVNKEMFGDFLMAKRAEVHIRAICMLRISCKSLLFKKNVSTQAFKYRTCLDIE